MVSCMLPVGNPHSRDRRQRAGLLGDLSLPSLPGPTGDAPKREPLPDYYPVRIHAAGRDAELRVSSVRACPAGRGAAMSQPHES